MLLAIDLGKAAISKNSEDTMELSFSGKINRKDFWVNWVGQNASGVLIVGDEIKLSAKIQFVKQGQNAKAEELK